jgi:hypothetical protein
MSTHNDVSRRIDGIAKCRKCDVLAVDDPSVEHKFVAEGLANAVDGEKGRKMRESGRAPFLAHQIFFSVVRAPRRCNCTAVHRHAPPCTAVHRHRTAGGAPSHFLLSQKKPLYAASPTLNRQHHQGPTQIEIDELTMASDPAGL